MTRPIIVGSLGRILKKYGPNHPIEDLGRPEPRRHSGRRSLRSIVGKRQWPPSTIMVQVIGLSGYHPGIFPCIRRPGTWIRLFHQRWPMEWKRVRLNGILPRGLSHGGDIPSILPNLPSSVDIVVSLETLEHLGARCRDGMRIFRVIVPGGCMILSVPNIRPFPMSRNFFSYVL